MDDAGRVSDTFPDWFFDRDDETTDVAFYGPPRLVTHIDDTAIAAVGQLYAELGVDGSAPAPRRVLDLMSSWVSHLPTAPAELVVLGTGASGGDKGGSSASSSSETKSSPAPAGS